VPVLNNCGPGPMTVYRTGAVGLVRTVSLDAVLLTLLAQVGITEVHGGWVGFHDGATRPAAIIEAAACAALVRVGAGSDGTRALLAASADLLARAPSRRRSAASSARACDALAALGAALPALGPQYRFVGTVAQVHDPADHALPDDLPWIAPADVRADGLHVPVWLLLAFAHCAPPVLLHTRAPSLLGLDHGACLRLRWFGGGTPS